MVRLGGFEPPTSGATILRSNQLSYNRTASARVSTSNRFDLQEPPATEMWLLSNFHWKLQKQERPGGARPFLTGQQNWEEN